jgi:hypothetical protein
MKYASVLLALGCLVTAVAQQWQVELVDTSFRRHEVFVRRDGPLCRVAYLAAEGNIRIASRDTAWSYENLDTGLVRPGPYDDFHLALGPGGRMAVSGVDDSVRPVVVEKSDSGWGRIWTHEELPYVSWLARAVYGADSVPTVIYCSGNYYVADVIVETRLDSMWHADTARHFDPGSQNCELELYDADGSPESGPCFLIQYSFGLPKLAKSPWTFVVYKGFQSGGGWRLVWLGGGFNVHAVGYDIVAGGDDTASAAVYSSGYSLFDHDSVWTGRATDAAVQVDTAGRRLMAFVTSDSVLRFAYKDTRWHFREVMGVTTATCCDLALDEYGQPLIAYEDDDGLWLARGIDVLGVVEGLNPQATSRTPASTVIRSLPQDAVAFDAMGRRATRARAGVYFVRDEGRGPGDAGRMRKVIVQR